MSDGGVSPPETRSGVQSVEIAMRVLEFFAAATGPQPLRNVAKGTGLAPSAAHRYVVSLVRAGALQQLHDQRYDLGPFATRLGFAALSRNDPLRVATNAMEEFVGKTGVTAMVAVWSEQGPLVVCLRQGVRPVFTTIAVGAVLPLDRSATGNVFAAWHDGRQLAPVARGQNLANLRMAVREQGYAQISGNFVPGLNAVSAPVIDGTGTLIAAITAFAASDPVSAASIDALIECSSAASAALGFRAFA